jgi:polysaccharide export outer membrane protein
MPNSITAAFAFLLILPASACAQTIPQPETATRTQESDGDTAASVAESDYKLGVADKVRIIVFNEQSLSGEFVVSGAGMLSLPLIGSIPAAGQSVAELSANIETRFADGYLRDPKVSVEVLTYRPFFIMGEVAEPGEYPYADGLTVLNAIAKAQGFTYRANKRRVFLRRAGEREERKVELTPDLMVEPGDTIRIGERYF